jgi:hypothetical protein
VLVALFNNSPGGPKLGRKGAQSCGYLAKQHVCLLQRSCTSYLHLLLGTVLRRFVLTDDV